MQKIRIIAIPPGQAPKMIREQWVGSVIPLLEEQRVMGLETGVLGGGPENMGGYRVDTDEAICALVEKNTPDAKSAAYWWIDWRENTQSGRDSLALVFDKNVCKLIP